MPTDWNSYDGGRAWKRNGCGEIIAQAKPTGGFAFRKKDGGYLYRTKGDPLTAYTAIQDFHGAIYGASAQFEIPVALIIGMMAVEATKQKDDRSHFNPRSLRLEPGYVSDLKTPNKVSPGLMQTLISTAQGMNDKFEIYKAMDGTIEQLSREDLFVPERSIMLGAAYMRYHIDRKETDEVGFDDDDPVLLCSAYNAGSVRGTTKNDWHLLTYGKARMDKFVAYYNDTVAVLDR